MRTFKLGGFVLFATLLCLSACSSRSDNPIEPTPKPEIVKSEITIDSNIISNGLSFSSAGGEQSISFSTNESWTLTVASTTSGATWFTASTTSGTKGNATIKFSATENTDHEDRSVSVTIKSGTATKTFTITQKNADALLITTDKYEVSQKGGTIEIEVKANIDYKMEISEKAKDWIKESSSRALTTYKHTLNISTNEEVEKREGEIHFKSGDKVETVKVYQAGGIILLLSQNEYNVSDKGDTISVDVKSNFEFGVQIPDVDWIINEASSRGLSSHTLKYVIKANEEYDTRSAEIVFFDKNSNLKDTLKIVQAQKDAIIVTKNEYTIDASSRTLDFEVNTNVDFKVETSVNWIKQNTESRGLETKPLSFTIAKNTTDEAREGLITISSGEIKQEIKIIQKAKLVFSLSKTEFNISSDGGEFNIEVSTNGEYTITMPKVDWLTENNSRATSTYTHIFTVSVNETYDIRKTEITFTHKETNEVIKVKVVQNQKNAIVISEKNICVAKEGETVEVKVNTNVEFEVEIPSDATWITLTDSRALTEKGFYLKVFENTSEESRSATITITDKDNQVGETVVITQQGNTIVVILKEAGTMKNLLGNDYLNVTSLKIVGPINGDDVYYLRRMLGGDETEIGKLACLDLSEATIIEGGRWYFKEQVSTFQNEYYHTSNNTIGDYMFIRCANLQNIILPTSAKSIGFAAFHHCDSLRSAIIPNNIVSIGNHAFSYCKSIVEIVVPKNVTSIGIQLFSNCYSLTSVAIPNGINLIDYGAFRNCI